MINLFPKTRTYFVLGVSLAFLAAAAMFHDGIYWLWCLLAFLGMALLVLIIMEARAATMHRQLLGILYVYMNPKDFIEVYAPLLDRKYIKSNVKFSMYAYLSNAYAADGNYKKALSILNNMPKLHPKRCSEGEALVACNKCDIYLKMGELESAKAQYDIFYKYSAANPKNPIDGGDILKVKMNYASGQISESDADDIRETLKKSNSPMHRAELQLLLGDIYLALGETEFARSYYKDSSSASKQLWVSKLAAERLKNI